MSNILLFKLILIPQYLTKVFTYRQNIFYRRKKALIFRLGLFSIVAEWTGLEPATPGVTGRYSNQLNYHSAVSIQVYLNLKPGDVLLSHGETPHYHRRYYVSLLSSAWDQVGP